MDTLRANLQAIRARIAAAAQQAGRSAADVGLIAVTKGCSAHAILAAHAAGQSAFGENYVQEALQKMGQCSIALAGAQHPLPGIEWHLIGPIQSNKTRAVAENFAWVHSIDRAKIAQRLSAARPAALPPLQVCIEVNLGNEHTKSGVAPEHALELARGVAALPGLRLRGLMAIPPASADFREQRRHFAKLRELQQTITATGIMLDTLSMGMSADFEAAIAEGATWVRIGTAIFGERRRA